LLYKLGKYRLPEDARFLIEGVYGDDVQADIPDTLLQQSIEAEGSDHADASMARLNTLSIELGYSDIATNRWWDESKTPTRLGEESVQVYLAKWEAGKLVPWSDEQENAWQFSAVSMRTFWITSESPTTEISQELIDACKVDLPAKGKWGVLLPLTFISGDDWQGVARNAKNETIQFIYNQKFGLIVDPELPQKDTCDESD
jgi:CRISPR-associated endonuclease/helicase Cas3